MTSITMPVIDMSLWVTPFGSGLLGRRAARDLLGTEAQADRGDPVALHLEGTCLYATPHRLFSSFRQVRLGPPLRRA